jgi:hypothetical protein
LKKRSKKLLLPPPLHVAGQGPYLAAYQEVKVFWFFFSKKNFFLYALT